MDAFSRISVVSEICPATVSDLEPMAQRNGCNNAFVTDLIISDNKVQ